MLIALFFEFHLELLCSHSVYFMPLYTFSLCKTDHNTRHCTVSAAPNVLSHKSVIQNASGSDSPTASTHLTLKSLGDSFRGGHADRQDTWM